MTTIRNDFSMFCFSNLLHRRHHVPAQLALSTIIFLIFSSTSNFLSVTSQSTVSRSSPPVDETIALVPPPASSHYLEQTVTAMPANDPTTSSSLASSENLIIAPQQKFQANMLGINRTANAAGVDSALAHASKTLAWRLNNISLTASAPFASENYVLSPYSLTTAFGMALLGAKASTFDELLNGLALSAGFKTLPSLIDALKAAQSSIERDGDLAGSNDSSSPRQLGGRAGAELNTVSKLYLQQGSNIQREYVANLRRAFDTQLAQVDFQGNTDGVRSEINQFVAQATNDKIKDLLPPDSLDALTRLVLISAIYLKAEWQNKFKPEATNNSGEFYVAHEKRWRHDVPMMSLKKELEYADNDAAQFVWLPYRGGEVTMIVAVPRERDGGLEALRQQLNSADALGKLRRQSSTVQLTLPRFKIETTSDLKNVMQKLNVLLPFDADRADFSGILENASAGPKVAIDKAIQKVYIKVDEAGTEAAAATAVVMAMRSALLFTDHKNVVEVHADRPFMFWIEHNPTGLVLFSGAVVDPK